MQWDTLYCLSIRKEREGWEIGISSSDASADVIPSVRQLRHGSAGHFMFMHIIILCEMNCAYQSSRSMGLPQTSDRSHWEVQGLETLEGAQEEGEKSFFVMLVSPRSYTSVNHICCGSLQRRSSSWKHLGYTRLICDLLQKNYLQLLITKITLEKILWEMSLI